MRFYFFQEWAKKSLHSIALVLFFREISFEILTFPKARILITQELSSNAFLKTVFVIGFFDSSNATIASNLVIIFLVFKYWKINSSSVCESFTSANKILSESISINAGFVSASNSKVWWYYNFDFAKSNLWVFNNYGCKLKFSVPW